MENVETLADVPAWRISCIQMVAKGPVGALNSVLTFVDCCHSIFDIELQLDVD